MSLTRSGTPYAAARTPRAPRLGRVRGRVTPCAASTLASVGLPIRPLLRRFSGYNGVPCSRNYRAIPAPEPRRRPESNRCKRLCRPLRSHSATAPEWLHPTALSGVPVGREAGVDLAPALRQGVDARALLVAQPQVEHVEVLDPPLVAGGLRDGADLRLVEQPAQRDLARRLAVRLADLLECRVGGHLAACQRRVGRHHEVVLDRQLEQLVLAEERVELDLVREDRQSVV